MATSSTGEIDFPVMKEAAPAMKSTGTIGLPSPVGSSTLPKALILSSQQARNDEVHRHRKGQIV
jgi:hypothetical protein